MWRGNSATLLPRAIEPGASDPSPSLFSPAIDMSSKRKWDQPAEEETASKVAKTDDNKTASEAAAAAAAIAAKIAAQFAGGGASGLLGPKDPHDGEFAKDIDINDVRNRYVLTKGTTQQQVRGCTLYFRAALTSPFRFTRKQALQSPLRVSGILTGARLPTGTRPSTFT